MSKRFKKKNASFHSTQKIEIIKCKCQGQPRNTAHRHCTLLNPYEQPCFIKGFQSSPEQVWRNREQKETGPPGQGRPRVHPSHRRKITMKTNQTKKHKTEKPRSSILHKQNSRMKKKNKSATTPNHVAALCV